MPPSSQEPERVLGKTRKKVVDSVALNDGLDTSFDRNDREFNMTRRAGVVPPRSPDMPPLEPSDDADPDEEAEDEGEEAQHIYEEFMAQLEAMDTEPSP